MTTSHQPNATAVDVALSTVNFWIHALLIKLLPCVLMSLFGFLLVLTSVACAVADPYTQWSTTDPRC